MLELYLQLIKIALNEFSDIVDKADLQSDKIHLILIDNSWIDIRYPVPQKYSFHWQRENEIYRFDTAPHHQELQTYPLHVHFQQEEDVRNDYLFNLQKEPEENFRAFLNWVKTLLI